MLHQNWIIRRKSMGMKVTVMAIVMAATMGITGLQQASANSDSNHEDHHRSFHKLDAASKEKIEKFRAENKDLRKQIAMKRAEQSALLRSESPKIEAVRKTAGELFDLKTAMIEKASAAGISKLAKGDGEDEKFAERHAKLEKFFAENKDLRKQIAVEKAEKRALMHNRTPDPQAIAKVAGTLFDLKNSLHEKAMAAGLSGYWHKKGKGRHFSQSHNPHGMIETI